MGVIPALIGTLFKVHIGLVHRVFGRLNMKPVVRSIIGALIIGLIGSFLPLTLYSGQNQLLQIVHNPAAYGIRCLMMLVKMLFANPFATGFEGGPIFPLLFIGGTVGTGSIRNSNIHSTRCRCTCRYGRCGHLSLFQFH